MGMYTSVRLSDGSELQFKSDVDDCETYKVGDVVNWRIWPDQPGTGKLLDGVYDAVLVGDKSKTEVSYSVAIDNHRIVYAGRSSRLKGVGKIVPWERGWWSESAWLKKDREDIKFKLRMAKEQVASLGKEARFLSTLSGLSDDKIALKRKKFYHVRFQKTIVSHFTEIMSRPSLTRQLLMVTPAKSKKTRSRPKNKKRK